MTIATRTRPLLAATLSLVLVAASPAIGASPTPTAGTPRPLAGDIAAARTELARLDDSLDVADEQYRNGQLALQKAHVQQAAAQRQLAAGKARRKALQARVDAVAAVAYQNNAPPDLVLVTQQDTDDVAETAAMVSQLAASAQATLSAAAAAQYDLTVAQVAARQSADATARTAAALATTKASILAQVAQHKALVESLVARQQHLEAVAAEKARLAALAAAKAAAEHRAAERKKAEEAAARAEAAARKAAQEAAAAKAAAQHEAAQRAADRRRAAQQAARRAAQQRQASTDGGGSSAGPPSSRAAVAVAKAYSQLGAPYDWAADGPGAFDCSGLTAYVWAAAGVDLPHSSQAQFDVGAHVSRGRLAPGDLVFFGSPIHHVGIYVGNGRMIDAPQTGDVVRVQSIDRSDYAGAVRVTG